MFAFRYYFTALLETLFCTVVSTNFLVAQFVDDIRARVTASWLLSVFGQLQMELNGIDQEGMRKLESRQIGNILIPDFSIFSNEDKQALISAYIDDDPLDFTNIIIRDLDELWETYLNKYFGLEIKVSDVLYLFQDILDDRSP